MRNIPKAIALIVAVSACHPGVSGAPAPANDPLPMTVQLVLTTQALVGENVVVSGHCFDHTANVKVKGGWPMPGRAWLLEDNGAAVWVTGPRPEGCRPGVPSTESVVITARVAQDTIPRFGPARRVRQYLVTR